MTLALDIYGNGLLFRHYVFVKTDSRLQLKAHYVKTPEVI